MFDKKLLPLTYLFNLMLRVIGVVSFIYIEFTGITHFEIEVLANVANNRRDTKRPWTVIVSFALNERVNKWLIDHNQKQFNNNQKSYVTRPTALLSPPPPEAWFAIYMQSWAFIQILKTQRTTGTRLQWHIPTPLGKW